MYKCTYIFTQPYPDSSIIQQGDKDLIHATNLSANGVEHASLLLMPIDMYSQKM